MKYKLTSNTKNWWGITLYQIQATCSFNNVSKGDLGGYIEKESNLDQSDNAWVHDNAQVSGDARVSGDAWVFGNAWVHGNAQVFGNAQVYGNARVSGNAQVYGNAWVHGNARVYGNAWVYGNARVYDNAQVSGNAWVSGELKLSLGFFFGVRYKKEEIKYHKLDDNYEIIYKGDAKIEEEQSLVGSEVEVKLNGKSYKAKIISG